jgi:gliding motility-associated-like protein
VVQHPGNANQYFIFTADADVGPNGIKYSVVDMTLSAGLGAVITKNVLLQTPSCEKLCAVRHCNNRDVWIVSHDWNSNTFRTWLVSPTGVNTTPVLSSTGVTASGVTQSAYGQLKSNLDGNKLAAAYYGFSGSGTNKLEVYDFNNSTGVVSNALTLASDIGFYACEFSPDGRVVYGGTNPGTVVQYNLCAASSAAIVSSRYVVGTLGAIVGAMQLGPDGKIYLTRNTTFLSVINNPNTLGIGCNYVNGAISLAGRSSRVGLPNMAALYLRPQIAPFTYTANCLSVGFTSPTANSAANSCAGAGSAITGAQWNFGDPASGAANTSTTLNPTHVFSAVGNYTVQLILNLGCYNDTLTQTIAISGFNVSTSTTPASCGASNGTASVTPALAGTYSYAWSNGQTTQTATGLAAGTHSVNVTSASGCTATASVTVSSGSSLSLAVNPVNAACNGQASGSATATVSGGTSPYTYAWSNGATGSSASGLAAGTYSLTVTDAAGCTAIQNFTISQPTALAATTSVTNPGCAGGTASASVSVSGGTTPYTYSWSTGAATASVSGLANGTYSVVITDNRGCSLTRSVTVNMPASLSATLSTTPAGCNGASTGTASIAVSGGTAPYTYAWSTGASTANVSALPAGSISVTVTDANGCTITRSGTITQPAALTLALTATQPSCSLNQGSATSTVSGGTSPYTYAWSNGASTSGISGVTAGTYTLTVTDASGCSTSQAVTFNPVIGISVSVSSTAITCNGAANGSATATVNGGGAPYAYSWSNGGNTASISNLGPGTYVVSVTNASGCSASSSVTLNQPAGMSLSLAATDATCGASNGTIVSTLSGGTAPYSYSWNTAPAQSGTTATNLNSGTYTLTVTDATGCTQTASAMVNNTGGLSLNATVTQNIACFGASTGAAVAAANGGTAPYAYSWSNGASTANNSGLVAGTYSVTVTDASGCTTSGSVQLNQPSALTANTASTSITCNGANDGTATVSVSGGTSPYSYSWSNGGNAAATTGLAAGTQSVTVSDWNGCSVNRTVVLTEPSAIVVTETVSAPLCSGASTGSISLSATGGTAPYMVTWSNGSSGLSLNNLANGLYSYTLTDASGCTATGSVFLTNPSALQVQVQSQDVLCFNSSTASIDLSISGGTAPYTVLWDNGDATEDLQNIGSGIYVATITDAAGCQASQSVAINEPDSLSFTYSVTASSCSGSTGTLLFAASGGTAPYEFALDGGIYQASPFFGNLTAGNHVIELRDANQCILQRSVNVPSPTGISLTVAGIQDVRCNGGSDGAAQAQVIGGTAPFTITWSSGESGANASQLQAGLQYATVVDAAGCLSTQNFSVAEPNALTVQSTITAVTCFGGSDGAIQLNVSGGSGTYTYAWDNGNTSNQLSNLPIGFYEIIVSDANGCMAYDTLQMTQPAQPILVQSVVNPGDCGTTGGTINLLVSGGTAPYAYQWAGDPSLNGPVAGNLSPGVYSITITDAQGCQHVQTETIANYPPVVAVVDSVHHARCAGSNDGAVFLSVSGGTAPYSYQWGQGLQSALPATLPSGTYALQVLDANGCSTTANFTINQPLPILVSATTQDLTCYQAGNGRILLSISGGTQPYSYQWSDGAQTQNLNNIAAGSYTCQISDANGCTENITASVSEPAELTVSTEVLQPGCDGNQNGSITLQPSGGTAPYSYQWSTGSVAQGIAGLGPGTYVVNVLDNQGCTTQLSEDLQSDPAFTITITGDSVLCAGDQTLLTASAVGVHNMYQYEWEHGPLGATIGVNPVESGYYTVRVTDSTGCSGMRSVFVEVNPIPVVQIIADDSTGCAPFCAKLHAESTTATTFLWNFSDGQQFQTEQALPCFNLPGIYAVQLVAEDAAGCKLAMNWDATLQAFPSPQAAFAATPTETTLDNPQVYVSDQSQGASSYSYHFGDPSQSLVFMPDAMHTYSDTGSFEVTLQVSNVHGCTDEAVQTIHIGGFTAFYIPKAFTPNSDGVNDVFLPKATGLSPEGFEMRIYDRWGNLIFFSNSWDKGWDGTIDGRPVPIDQYVCKVRYFDKRGNQNDHIGSVVVSE